MDSEDDFVLVDHNSHQDNIDVKSNNEWCITISSPVANEGVNKTPDYSHLASSFKRLPRRQSACLKLCHNLYSLFCRPDGVLKNKKQAETYESAQPLLPMINKNNRS